MQDFTNICILKHCALVTAQLLYCGYLASIIFKNHSNRLLLDTFTLQFASLTCVLYTIPTVLQNKPSENIAYSKLILAPFFFFGTLF